MIFIHSDWSEVDDELDRLSKMPTMKTKLLLNAVLETGFTAVRVATHVDTGSLKGSEKKSSSAHGSYWSGSITAGGPSLGVNNPVDYAIYEKRRGGDHDFFLPLVALHPLYIAAIKKGLSK